MDDLGARKAPFLLLLGHLHLVRPPEHKTETDDEASAHLPPRRGSHQTKQSQNSRRRLEQSIKTISRVPSIGRDRGTSSLIANRRLFAVGRHK